MLQMIFDDGENDVGDIYDICLNIAVGGYVSNTPKDNILFEQIDRILQKSKRCAGMFNISSYGFSGSPVKVNLYSGPCPDDTFWSRFAESGGIPLNIIISDIAADGNKTLQGKTRSVTNINISRKSSVVGSSVIPDLIADQTDFAILLWDGSEDYARGETWALIQACKRNNIPCIWIDVNTPADVYWAADSYFEPFSDNKLQTYISSLFCEDSGAFEPSGKSRVFSWKLWSFLYGRFMKKYKAKGVPAPYMDDKVLEDCCENGDSEKCGGSNLKKLAGWFHYFDRNAVEYARKYRASIYMRSIVPFIAAVFIAFGFFAETILGFIYSFDGFELSPWAILASIGFLVNGLIYFYVYRLAENPVLSSWHPRFIDNRFIAEVLRLTAHFMPFGIPVNYKYSLNKFGSRIPGNPSVSCELRRRIRSIEPESVTFDKKMSEKLLINLRNMINDQIKYHGYSAQRYSAITKRLKRLASVLFAIGLGIVVFRGFLQFVLVYVDIGSERNGIRLEAFIKSLINMLASIFPAWASYFSLKLSLGNFEGLLKNSEGMKEYMTVMKNTLDNEIERKDVSFERIYLFSRDLTRLMLGEAADWYSQISSQKFTKL